MSVNKNKRPKLSAKGSVKFFLNSAESVSACQIYREVAKNSFEAHGKLRKIRPDHKGTVIVKEDENFKNKISIQDNGIGMSKNNISDLIINLSETEEESEHGNYGIGTKVAGFANNKYGLIYTSKRYNEDIGSRCRVYFDETDLFGVQHSDEHNSCTIPVELESLPKLIRDSGHGTSLVLAGNSEKEDTTIAPENFEASSILKGARMGIHWLKAYYNTKFWRIPEYVNFLVEVIREGRKTMEFVYGHKHYLDKYKKASGTLEHESAKIHWWILSDEYGKRNSATDCFVSKGHLGIIHNDEMINLTFDHFGMKNPIRHWGLDFAHKDVAVIIEPKGFKQDHYRTGLRKNKADIESFIPIFKDFFVENMPEEIRKYEEELHSKFAKKMEDDNVFAKEMQSWLNDLNFKSDTGSESITAEGLFGHLEPIKGDGQGAFFNSEGSRESGIDATSKISKDPLFAGIKTKNAPDKGRAGSVNSVPEVILVAPGTQENWVLYNWDKHKIFIQEDCPLFKIYAEKAHSKTGRKKTLELHITNAKNVIKKICQSIVVMTRYGNNQILELSQEQRKEKLTDEHTFSLPLLNTWMILNEVVSASKFMQRQINEYEAKKHEMEQEVQLPGIN
tara:strand:+ start:1107 stop:2963 length:1857 start_codon:yes stop_codon:yes gene_type:complete